MSKELILKFKDVTFTVRTNEDGLYCLNDIAKAFDEQVRLNDHTKYLTAFKYDNYRIIQKKGKGGGTFGNKLSVVWLSSRLDERFEFAVHEAFEAASEGRMEDAVDIATSVVVPQELLDTIKAYTEAIQKEIPIWNSKQNKDRGKRAYLTIWTHIIDKTCVNTSTSQLKISFTDVKSVRDYLEKCKHVKGLGAYLATLKLTLPMLRAGVDYYDIKSILVADTKL